jgi:2,3-bisphosphoglycerate-independent phosphoglycerate mutase
MYNVLMQWRVILLILDGWGLASASPTNSISVARTPNFDALWSSHPHIRLAASGEAVGLPEHQMGNSEVGHLNIGAGRVVWQDLLRIQNAIKDKSFYKNQTLATTFAYAIKNNKPIHMMGLLSDGGVHSHSSHLFALLKYAKDAGVSEVFIHPFTDGRDVAPKSALKYLTELELEIRRLGIGKIATISGRYYTMDRDKRWDRTKLAYDVLVSGKGELADSAQEAIEDSYARGVTDEFIRPTVIDSKGVISSGDPIIFFNLRSDRPRQLSRALVDPDFTGFERHNTINNPHFVTMTEYDPLLRTNGVIFPFENIKNVLSEIISENGLNQLHIAETEKYAHVTFFLDGGKETQIAGEDRILVPSPKVSTYDKKPEMSATEVGQKVVEQIGKYDFIVVNFANADMVGHTGKIRETSLACEAVDIRLGEIVTKALDKDYTVIVTADHGNAEKMRNQDGSPCTSHTTSQVPFILIDTKGYDLTNVPLPKLGNIAPTILDLMKLPKPKDMTEASLLINK